MARLVSYKARDENRYSTFGGEVECNSSENLTETNRIKLMFKTKSSSASTSNGISQVKKKTPIKSSKKCRKSMPSSQRVTISTIASSSPSALVSNGGTSTTMQKSWQSSRVSKSKFNCCSFWPIQCARKRNCTWRQFCCCCSRTVGCFCCSRCRDNVADDDDDDIDAKFEQYKREMNMHSAASGDGDDGGAMGHDNNALQVPEIIFSTDQIVTFHTSGSKKEVVEPMPSPTKSKRFRYRKYWNWNDSLRSNSDKFLETLEYDMDGENSLQRNQHMRIKGLPFYTYLMRSPQAHQLLLFA